MFDDDAFEVSDLRCKGTIMKSKKEIIVFVLLLIALSVYYFLFVISLLLYILPSILLISL